MKNFKITKRDLTFIAIGSIAMLILAYFLNRKENNISGSGPVENSSGKMK